MRTSIPKNKTCVYVYVYTHINICVLDIPSPGFRGDDLSSKLACQSWRKLGKLSLRSIGILPNRFVVSAKSAGMLYERKPFEPDHRTV